MQLSLQILFVYFLALPSYFILQLNFIQLYHSSDVVIVYNFFKQFLKARLNTYWDRDIKARSVLFSDLYTYKPWDSWIISTCLHGCMYSIMFTGAGNHAHSTLYKFFVLYRHTCMHRHINSTLLSFLLLTRLSHTILQCY